MIEVQNLKFGYRKQSLLFKNLSLEVGPGTIVGLLGKNGAGKSTLLKLMAGALFPQKGSIFVLSHQPQKRNPSFLKDIFYVPEEIYLPSIQMRSYARAVACLYPSFNQGKMKEIMHQFQLDGSMQINKVSYGQKKKFLIALALSTECKLLILDEPTNGLDIPSKALFRKVVASSISEEQTVFISTHQVMDVENLIDKVMIIENGSIVLNQSLFELSEQYSFLNTSTAKVEGALYSEEVPGGYKVIVPCSNTSTDVDIEVLFNAVISGTPLN